MKRIILLLAIVAFISSCTKNNNYGPIYNNYIFEDDFDDNRHGWNFSDGANLAYGVINNGTFKIDYNDDKYAAYYVSQQLGFRADQNFTIESRIGSNKNIGLLFGYNDKASSYGYSITIDYDGRFALYDEGGNGRGTNVQELIAPQAHNAVRKNGDWNTVKIEQRNGSWYGYINGINVFQIAAQRLMGTGIGYVIMPKTQGEADYILVNGYQ